MSAKIGTVYIEMDADTAKLVDGMKKTDRSVRSVKKSLDRAKRSVAAFIATAASVYTLKQGFDAVFGAGFEWNKMMEEQTSGLRALMLAVRDQAIPLQQRMAEATLESAAAMRELSRINERTPHTLGQTAAIFKAMYVSMKKAGLSTQQIITLTEKLSIAAGAAGIEFNQLLAGVDGLATGTVLANSELGRFLSSLGLTNEKLRESDDIYATIMGRLGDFQAIDTMETALSNLSNTWGDLTSRMTAGSFAGAKEGAKELSSLLSKLSDDDVAALSHAIDGLAAGAATAFLWMAKGVAGLYEGFSRLGARIAAAAFYIENGFILDKEEEAALERMREQTKSDISAAWKLVDALEQSRDRMVQRMNAGSVSAAPNGAGDNAEETRLLRERFDIEMPQIEESDLRTRETIRESAEKIVLEMMKDASDNEKSTGGIVSAGARDCGELGNTLANEIVSRIDRVLEVLVNLQVMEEIALVTREAVDDLNNAVIEFLGVGDRLASSMDSYTGASESQTVLLREISGKVGGLVDIASSIAASNRSIASGTQQAVSNQTFILSEMRRVR